MRWFILAKLNFVLANLVFVLANLPFVLADVATELSDYAPLLSTVGSLGFAVWYAWYTTTVSIPKMQEAHRVERAEIHSRFDAALNQERTEFTKAVEGLLTELRETRLALQNALSHRRDSRSSS